MQQLDAAAPAFDPLSISFTANPHPVLKVLRESDPVHFLESPGCWVLTRYDDVRTYLGDRRVRRLFNSGFLFDAAPSGPADSSAVDEHHAQQRRSISTALSPQAVKRGIALIDRTVRERMKPLRESDGIVDVVPVLGAIPNIVVTRYFGVAPDGRDESEFFRVTREAFRCFNAFLNGDERARAGEAVRNFHALLAPVVAQRRVRPDPDRAIDLFESGREHGGLDDGEILSWLAGLIMAGSEATAQSALAMARIVVEHPDQADRLRQDPSLIPNAVMEMLRFDLMGKFIARIATEDFDLRGRTIREGDAILISPTSAHRDPAMFPDPERLDVGRDLSNEMAFGRGAYGCVGAHIAIAELSSILRELLDIFPRGSRVLEDALVWDPTRYNIRLIDSLPIARAAGSPVQLDTPAGYATI